MLNTNADCWYKDVCSRRDVVVCGDSCLRYLSMRALLDKSNIPENRQHPVALKPEKCDITAFNQLADIKDYMQDFVNSGKNLYITSATTGNGKTTWAIKMMLKWFDCVWAGNGFERCRGVFVHVPTFLMMCKDFKTVDTDFEYLKKCIQSTDLVVWDDIASTDMSSYDYSQLLMYLDIRVSNRLSNIYTGNITTKESLQKALGSKLTSRVWSNTTTVIQLRGSDRR